jgi:DNA helicase-2/ATP-dependent DNA helicase PcrA
VNHILDGLNPSQKKAVEATDGPLMVIAGAGSGKTRVLTMRIAYLMAAKKIDPFNILSLTFTNKAAREMKERIGKIVGASEAKNIWMGTFHSVFARILRVEGSLLGYPSNFTIYDAEDQKKAINNVIKELNLDKEIYKVNNVARRISAYKNGLITPREYFQSPDLQEREESARMPQFGEVFNAYNEKCFRAGAMDFDDILLNTYLILRQFPDVLAKYQDRFRYILVDEYQDTNHAQYLIVKALANRFQNICVVGDDAQSIYAFRGANIQNILNFQRDYDQVRVFKLEQNYRSTKNIVGAANSLIAKNRDQLEKNVWTDNDHGDRITLHKTVSDNDEGAYVARSIFDIHRNEQKAYSDFAILYRTNAQSRAMEDALRRKNIPYRIYGGLSFYQRKEVKDLLAYCRLAINKDDEEALRRVINYPKRGIGDTTIERITVKANHEKLSLWEICEKVDFYRDLRINRSAQNKIKDFVTKIESYQIMAQKGEAFDVVSHIAQTSGLLGNLKEDKTPEGVNRVENIEELLNSVREFTEDQKEVEDGDVSLAGFMQDVALITDQDRNNDDDQNKVSLMTIHLAKGLEFPVVFIVGLEENLFPSMLTVNSRADLEEERRLFYVALTRAEQRAFLTYTQMRYRWGKLVDCEPSRFLEEIDPKFIDESIPDFSPFLSPEEMSQVRGRSAGETKRSPQLRGRAQGGQAAKPGHSRPPKPNLKRLRPTDKEDLSGKFAPLKDAQSGQRVKHPRFGLGVIKELEGNGPNQKAIITFDNVGEKKLLLKFAKLERLSK